MFYIVHIKNATGYHIYWPRFVDDIKNIRASEGFLKSRIAVKAFHDITDNFMKLYPNVQLISQYTLLCLLPCYPDKSFLRDILQT